MIAARLIAARSIEYRSGNVSFLFSEDWKRPRSKSKEIRIPITNLSSGCKAGVWHASQRWAEIELSSWYQRIVWYQKVKCHPTSNTRHKKNKIPYLTFTTDKISGIHKTSTIDELVKFLRFFNTSSLYIHILYFSISISTALILSLSNPHHSSGSGRSTCTTTTTTSHRSSQAVTTIYFAFGVNDCAHDDDDDTKVFIFFKAKVT